MLTLYEKCTRIHRVVTSHGAGKVTYHEKKSKLVHNIFYQEYKHFGEVNQKVAFFSSPEPKAHR